MIILKENTLTAEEWRCMRKSVNWTLHSLDDFKFALKHTLLTVAAYDRNEVIGMARITGDAKLSFYIQDVIVLPNYQKKGIGKNLINALLQYIYEHSAPCAIVSLMSSKGKESFYEKFGFNKRTGHDKGYGMELIIHPN